ncbi:hypothetical protein L6452_19286 [Arctium lappa]|uniref:Uncharacterized protein n=1 Tax=Arctium lappa TaxID=4217 RepID=A0ACB9B8A0_ARCLA|nr:hypothetical protein L6452_19286 [Arctium lappa]
MLLAKQQEAGKALMTEDEYWLDHSDEEEEDEERDEAVNMCLMGKQELDVEADSDDEEEEKLSHEIAEKKVLVEVLHRDNDTNAKEKTIILKENSELKSKLTKKEDEANETEKRLKSSKVHLPFYYAKMNNSYNENPIYQKKKTLSSDFFQSYSEKEMEAKPIQGKLYVPPLVLESKISELENSLSDERLLMNIEQKVFSTVFKNVIISKASNSEDMFGFTNKGFDFLNADGGLDDYSNQFDFKAKLPNHSSFVKKSLGKTSMPVNSAKSMKVDNSVSMKAKNAKGKITSKHSHKPNTTSHPKKKHSFVAPNSNSTVSHVSDLSKQRPKVKSLWQPKQ